MATPDTVNLLQEILTSLDAQFTWMKQQAAQQTAGRQQQQQQNAKEFIQGALFSALPSPFRRVVGNYAMSVSAARSAFMQAPGAPGGPPSIQQLAGGGAPKTMLAATAGGGATGGPTAAGGGAGGVGALGEVATAASVALVGLKTVVYDLPKAIYSWANSMLASQREIAKFSPELTAVFARFDVRQLQQEREFGRGTADTTGLLAEQMSDLNESLLPFRTGFTNVTNTIGAILVKSVQLPIDGLARVLGIQKDSAEAWKGEPLHQLFALSNALNDEFRKDGLPRAEPLDIPAFRK
jgi:hypothetical protein